MRRNGRTGRRAGASALVSACLLLAGACVEEAGRQELHLLSHPGSGGPVALNEALVLQFDQPLDPYTRAGAFDLRRRDARGRVEIDFEVRGEHLILLPRLPLLPELTDGTLLPKQTYLLTLYGVPRLSGFTSTTGAALVGTKVVEFETLGLDEPSALVGTAEAEGALRLDLSRDGPLFRAGIDRQGRVRIPVRSGIDPRSLVHPARLWRTGATEPEEVAVELEFNQLTEASLRIDVGPTFSVATLELPAELEGLGGRRLPTNDRRVALVPLP